MDRASLLEFAKIIDSPVDKVNSRNILIRCPLEAMHPRKGKSPTLSIKVEPGRPSITNCFVCSIGGTLTHVFTEAQKAFGGFDMALKFLSEFDRGDFMSALAANKIMQAQGRQAVMPTETSYQLERYAARCSRMVPVYLVEQRGIVKSDVDKWRLGFDEKRNRAVFPVWDEHRMLVGTTGRSVLPDGVDPPRYKDFPSEFARAKTNYFYGEHLVDSTLEHVYLCEGPLSVIYAARVLTNVLGVFGASTGLSDLRVNKLRRWARKVTILFDGDAAGRDAVYGKTDPHGRIHPGLRDVLRQYFSVNVATLPEGQDPASVPPVVLLDAIKEARYVF